MKKSIKLAAIIFALLVWACGSKKTEESAEDAVEATTDAAAATTDAASEAASDVAGAVDNAVSAVNDAATNSATYVDETGATVYRKAEVQPTFDGGVEAMTKWLGKNLTYPKDASEEGTVDVEFVVAEDGKVRNAKVVSGPEDEALRNEALRAVNAMPKWKAGTQGGKPVHVKFSLPITFKKI